MKKFIFILVALLLVGCADIEPGNYQVMQVDETITPDIEHCQGGECWRAEFVTELFATERPTFTPYPTYTPYPTATAYPTATFYPTYTIPAYTPEPTITVQHTPTQESTLYPPCTVVSIYNTWARSAPIVSQNTQLGILPANSTIKLDGYTWEYFADGTRRMWYMYWFDLNNVRAWSASEASGAALFTPRDTANPNCTLLLPDTTP